MAVHSSTLLSDANRQVQIADHLLTVTYPMVKDPKLLLSVMEHCRKAIEDSAQAVVEHHVGNGDYELPQHVMRNGRHDAVAAFADLVKIRSPNIPAANEAVALCHEWRQTLQEHKDTHTAFKRDEKLVIADEGFEQLKEVSPAGLKESLRTLKRFVHGANQYLGER
jgi:hypothetical protein